MGSYDSTFIVGHVGRNAELAYLESGRAVLEFSVAVNRRRRDRQTNEWIEVPEWFECKIYGERAEKLHTHITKGAPVMCSGTITARAYQGKSGLVAQLVLRVDDFEFLGAAASDA